MAGWQLTPRLQAWLDNTLDILFPPRCAVCREAGVWFCDTCLSRIEIKPDTGCPEGIDACVSLVPYSNKEMRILITRLKYQSAWCLLPAIESVISRHKIDLANTVVTWAPASERRIAERGIDHAELIAKCVSKDAIQLLERTKHTLTNAQIEQHELRQGNVAGVFRTIRAIPERVLLVDDVRTSGATAGECAKALKENGAKRVVLLTLAYGG